LKSDLGIAPDTPVVVCVSRLEPEKGVAALVEAVPRMLESCPRALCLIAGSGSQEPALRNLLKSLGVEDRVRLLGFRADAMSLIRAADVFVLPSPKEGAGMVLLEAMALGKPVVACRAGGPEEIVAPGVTGLLVPPDDPAALGEALAQLLGDASTRRQMGQAGLERFRQLYSAERMGRATLDVYRRALGEHRTQEVQSGRLQPDTLRGTAR
jgi:glycosyltransferase involved in cell wall biosynthesis